MWFDQMAIPADAPHVAEAHEVPELHHAAGSDRKSTDYVHYANGNKASQEFIDPEVLHDPAIYPDDATLAKLFREHLARPQDAAPVHPHWTKVVTGQ